MNSKKVQTFDILSTFSTFFVRAIRQLLKGLSIETFTKGLIELAPQRAPLSQSQSR
jgi:hypothetical protein